MRDPRKSGTDFLAGFGAGCLTIAVMLIDRIDPDDLIEISLAMGITSFIMWARFFFTEPAEQDA